MPIFLIEMPFRNKEFRISIFIFE